MTTAGREEKESLEEPKIKYEAGRIFLDKEGRWFHDGEEITHERTMALFSRSVQKDPAGGYCLVVGPEWAKIEVEDTPFMVRQVTVEAESVRLHLNDGGEEKLDPATLWIGKNNELYCRVKQGEFPARFLHPAYYELMHKCLEEGPEGFAVRLGEELWPLRRQENRSEE